MSDPTAIEAINAFRISKMWLRHHVFAPITTSAGRSEK